MLPACVVHIYTRITKIKILIFRCHDFKHPLSLQSILWFVVQKLLPTSFIFRRCRSLLCLPDHSRARYLLLLKCVVLLFYKSILIPHTLLKVAVYVPGSKGAPSYVRLYQYPNFGGPTSALANKSFFKADRASMLWNSKGRSFLF